MAATPFRANTTPSLQSLAHLHPPKFFPLPNAKTRTKLSPPSYRYRGITIFSRNTTLADSPAPLSRLPEIVREFSEHAQRSFSLDPISAVLPMLAVAGAAIGNSRAVRLYDDLLVRPVIWSCAPLPRRRANLPSAPSHYPPPHSPPIPFRRGIRARSGRPSRRYRRVEKTPSQIARPDAAACPAQVPHVLSLLAPPPHHRPQSPRKPSRPPPLPGKSPPSPRLPQFRLLQCLPHQHRSGQKLSPDAFSPQAIPRSHRPFSAPHPGSAARIPRSAGQFPPRPARASRPSHRRRVLPHQTPPSLARNHCEPSAPSPSTFTVAAPTKLPSPSIPPPTKSSSPPTTDFTPTPNPNPIRSWPPTSTISSPTSLGSP